MARPKKQIDFEQVEILCSMQCTGEEIAAVLKVDYDTLCARIKEKYKQSFSEYYKRFTNYGKASLRRMQFKAAESGNSTMLIWLGQQYLGQSNKKEVDLKEKEEVAKEITALAEQLNDTERD